MSWPCIKASQLGACQAAMMPLHRCLLTPECLLPWRSCLCKLYPASRSYSSAMCPCCSVQDVEANGHQELESVQDADGMYSAEHPFWASLTDARRLSAASSDRTVRPLWRIMAPCTVATPHVPLQRHAVLYSVHITAAMKAGYAGTCFHIGLIKQCRRL